MKEVAEERSERRGRRERRGDIGPTSTKGVRCVGSNKEFSKLNINGDCPVLNFQKVLIL